MKERRLKWNVTVLKYTKREWDNLFSMPVVGRMSNNGLKLQGGRFQTENAFC